MNQIDNDTLEREEKIQICGRVKYRYVTGIVCSLSATIQVFQRTCIQASLDFMVKPKNVSLTEQRSYCPTGPGVIEHDHFVGDYAWSENMIKYILLSFYIGYMISHLPVGLIADKYGYKWPYFATMVLSSIVTAATPYATIKWEKWGIFGMNILLGFAQGGLYPALSVVIAHWYPLNERSQWGGVLIGGNTLGCVLAIALAHLVFRNIHWKYLYFCSASAGGIISIFVVIFCYSYPQRCPFSPKNEKNYLKSHVLNVIPSGQKLPPVPWKLMLTSLPVWAYIVIYVGHDWILYGIQMDIPRYMEHVLRFDHTSVVIWSVVPTLLLWVVIIFWGFFSDYLLDEKLMNLNEIRKMNTLISSFGPGLCLIFSSYARCDVVISIFFFTMCVVTNGPFFAGAKLNAVDLCPNYSGTLMGISNGLGSLGAIAPHILHVFQTKDTLGQWRDAFWIDFTVICSTAVIFILFGSSDVQPWNSTFQLEDDDTTSLGKYEA